MLVNGVSAYTIPQCVQAMGEDALSIFLRGFSCPLNLEVEDFLKDKAWQSAKLSSSVTYLVWHDKRKDLLGYFTLMVERESDRPRLFDFYKRNGFKSWTTRRNKKDGILYDQMFAILTDA